MEDSHHTCFLNDDHRISKRKFRNLLVLMRMAKRKFPYLPNHDFFFQGFLSTGRTIELVFNEKRYQVFLSNRVGA
jgi:hypothetical protein